jgi:MFS family permease
MFSGIFTYYLILYALDILAISRSEWALLSSLMFLVSVIASLPLGRIIDAIGKKTPLVLSWIFNTASMLLLFHGDFPRLILSFVLYGIANALFASSPALRADLVPREFRGKIMGSQNFMGMLLNSVGILISGFLYDRVSPHIPFILYTIVTLPNIFLTWFFIHEPHKKEL